MSALLHSPSSIARASRRRAKGGSYLEMLAPCAIDRVLRHMSLRPNSTTWASFIDVKDALTLLCARGRVFDEFRTRVSRIRIVASNDAMGARGPPPSGELYLAADAAETGCILTIIGSALTDVAVSTSDARTSPFDRALLLVARHCCALRSLAVCVVGKAVLDNLLRVRGPQLRALSLDLAAPTTRDRLIIVARHCTDLRALALHLDAPAPRELWRDAAANLLDLRLVISNSARSTNALNGIRAHCRSLRRIDIEAAPTPAIADAVVRLCVPLGNQLELANLHRLPADSIAAIAIACPRTAFRVACTPARMRAAGDLHTFGPREPALFSLDHLMDIGSRCSQLRNLFLERPGRRAPAICDALLAAHPDQLSFVALELDAHNIDQVLTVLAIRVRSVRDFRAVVTQVPSPRVLSAFLRANPQLQRIEFISHFGRQVPSETLLDVADMIEACACSDSLRELLVLDLNEMQSQRYNRRKRRCPLLANACLPLRYKMVYVNVFGTDYVA